MEIFLGYIDRHFRSEGLNLLTFAKSLQITYALFYIIGIMFAYLLRLAGMASLYESVIWAPSIVFTSAYIYMQFDRINDKTLAPQILHLPLRWLAFAIMLTTLSQVALNIIAFTIVIVLMYLIVAFNSFKEPQVSVSTLLYPTIMAHALYIGLLIYNGSGSAFDYIAGWIVLLSVTLKISFTIIIERSAIMSTANKDSKETTQLINVEDESDLEDLSFEEKVSLYPFTWGYYFGRQAFLGNASSVMTVLAFIIEKYHEDRP